LVTLQLCNFATLQTMKIIRLHPYIVNLFMLLLAFIASVAIGAVAIGPDTVISVFLAKIPGLSIPVDWSQATETIIFRVRLPHTILILLTGAALAGSGATYQGLFRNPLADPYLIGVASGAGLGAVIAMSRSWPNDWLSLYAVPFGAFLAALLTVFIVYTLARTGNTLRTTTLILAGVAVSSFATALTSFLMLRSSAEMQRALGWLLGGGMLAGWAPVLGILPYICVGLGILVFLGHPLNVLQFGDDQAAQMGLSVE
jgi:iron complex transport system permease protein